MSNEWFIIANGSSNSGKTVSVIDKAVKRLGDEKIKHILNLTIKSGDEIDLVKKGAKNGYNKILAIGGDGTVQKVVAGIVLQQSITDVGRAITPGSTYHVIYYGKNTMGSYANQLSEKERWMVTSYVMKLKSDLSK